jgi:hypothetical protein
MAALDFESSDKDPETARIVSCALLLVGGGLNTDMSAWTINPGIAQEPGAIAVHGAAYDALQSARAAYKIGAIAHIRPEDRPDWVQQLRNRRGPYDRFNDLAFVDVEELHRRQVVWARDDAASYQSWLRDPAKSGAKHDPKAVIDGSWPLRPVGGGEG